MAPENHKVGAYKRHGEGADITTDITGHNVLDVGCAKRFMMYDFSRLIPGLSVEGIDISEYAIKNGMPEMLPYLKVLKI